MNNFVFENSTKVYFGDGCVKEYLLNVVSAYGDNVMFCYGGGSIKKNGIYDEIMGVLEKAGKTVVEFAGILSNPTYSKVLEGIKTAKENKADLILAVGGGSVMDCCKAISLGAGYDGDIWSDFWARPGVIDFEPLPLGIVVTASGTGSECNGGAVNFLRKRQAQGIGLTVRDFLPGHPQARLKSGLKVLDFKKCL